MKEEKSSQIARRLFVLIAPLKGWVIFSIVCMAGYNIFTAAPAYYAKDIVDTIAYGDNPDLKQYFLVGLGMMIVFAIKGLFFFGHNYSVGHLVQSLIVKLRQQLFDHLVNLSLTFFNRSKTGDLLQRTQLHFTAGGQGCLPVYPRTGRADIQWGTVIYPVGNVFGKF